MPPLKGQRRDSCTEMLEKTSALKLFCSVASELELQDQLQKQLDAARDKTRPVMFNTCIMACHICHNVTAACPLHGVCHNVTAACPLHGV